MKDDMVQDVKRVDTVSFSSGEPVGEAGDEFQEDGATCESIYSFENEGRRKFPDPISENEALKEFAKRLRLPAIVQQIGMNIHRRDLLRRQEPSDVTAFLGVPRLRGRSA